MFRSGYSVIVFRQFKESPFLASWDLHAGKRTGLWGLLLLLCQPACKRTQFRSLFAVCCHLEQIKRFPVVKVGLSALGGREAFRALVAQLAMRPVMVVVAPAVFNDRSGLDAVASCKVF